MAEALIEGLVSTGCAVRAVGRGPTPMLYYAAKARGADGGIMVTGSHNPPSHNGFKMVLAGKPFFGDDIKDLGRIAAAGAYAAGPGTATADDIADEYAGRLAKDFDGERGLNVVWDCGNGAAGEIVAKLTRLLPGHHTVLFGTIDGTFPNHHPDPTEPENLVDLQKAVAALRADIGIAFDGDGDRIGVIDGRGRILWGDQILVILAEDLLKSRPGATVIADVKASRAFFDEVARLGGIPVMGRTGHSLIKTQMAEIGAPCRRDERPHLLRRPLLRFRRRPLRRRAPAWHRRPLAGPDPGRA